MDVLKQQWCGAQTFARILLPSSSVKYSWSKAVADSILNKPCDTAANPVSGLTIGGSGVTAAGNYRITVNNFIADGGDNFVGLKLGTNRVGGGIDIDALANYLAPTVSGTPLAPPALTRITQTP